MSAFHALVEEGQAGRVVARHDKVRPAILVEIRHGQRLGIAGHDQTALVGRDAGKLSPAITAQQLAEAAVETAGHRRGLVGILHRINIGVAVAVEIARDDPLQRRDLGELRQRGKAESPVRLAQEYPAPKFRGGVALGLRQFFVAENLTQGGSRIAVVAGKAFQHRGNGGAEILPGSPRIEPVAFIVGFDQLLGAIALEITGEQQRGMAGVGPVLGVQAEIAHDIIDPAIFVEIRRCDRRPPPGARRGKARLLRPVLKPLALVVVEILHVAPLERQQQVRPPVAVHVAPERRGNHANFAQTGREGVGHILKPAAMIHEQGAARGEGVESGHDSRAQENIQPSVAIEIGRGYRTDAEGKRRQGVSRGRSQISVTIVEIEAGLIGRGTRGLADAGRGEQKIIRAVAIGIEKQRRSVIDRHVAGEGRDGTTGKLMVRTSQAHLSRIQGRPAENQIVLPVAIHIADRDRGPASILANREERIRTQLIQGAFPGEQGEVHRLAHLGELSLLRRGFGGHGRCNRLRKGLRDRETTIDTEIGEGLRLAAGPRDRDALDKRGFAQAEMQHGFGTRKDTPGQDQLADLNAGIGLEADHGADPEPV